MFRGRQAPEDVPVVTLPLGEVRLTTILSENHLAESISDAQRKIRDRGVRLNGDVVTDVALRLGSEHADLLIQVGKRKFLRVFFE
jgi:tyrosyl-tRNA synthetase